MRVEMRGGDFTACVPPLVDPTLVNSVIIVIAFVTIVLICLKVLIFLYGILFMLEVTFHLYT